MKPPRWTAITESEFPWEREALDWLRERLPDTDPWHAWSNFEFIDDDGKVNEVDVLVLAPGGLFLVEIKSRPGIITGDARTWTWTTDGREYSSDNPLYLANRKAKRLASLLKRQPSFVRARERLPWVEPAIFLSSTSSELQAGRRSAGAKTYLARSAGAARRRRASWPPSIPCRRWSVRLRRSSSTTSRLARSCAPSTRPAFAPRASTDASATTNSSPLLDDGINYQDWLAKHVSVETRRRLSIYGYGKATSPESRQALARHARREFQILEGIENPGILKVLDYKESELGPALVFEYDPNAERLDHFIQRRHAALDIGRRLYILRELADTLRYAHKKRLYHRALSPASVLIRETERAESALPHADHELADRRPRSKWRQAHRAHDRHACTSTSTSRIRPGSISLPRRSHGLSARRPVADVFALGAIAHLVLAGVPAGRSRRPRRRSCAAVPAASLRCPRRCGRGLQDLVRFSTQSRRVRRIGSVDEFIEYLDLAEEQLTAPEPERFADPSRAKPGDRIGAAASPWSSVSAAGLLGRCPAGQARRQRRGTGAQGRERFPTQRPTRAVRAKSLRKLRHQSIVECREVLEVAGRTALLMRRAGEKTLAQRLREEGRLSLDLLRRFGEELLRGSGSHGAGGVVHRDIKPDNIGIAPVGEKGHAARWCCSISRSRACLPRTSTPARRGYLDPFLSLAQAAALGPVRRALRGRGDLYEMATGTLPLWGDGQTAPDMLDCEATLATESLRPQPP